MWEPWFDTDNPGQSLRSMILNAIHNHFLHTMDMKSFWIPLEKFYILERSRCSVVAQMMLDFSKISTYSSDLLVLSFSAFISTSFSIVWISLQIFPSDSVTNLSWLRLEYWRLETDKVTTWYRQYWKQNFQSSFSTGIFSVFENPVNNSNNPQTKWWMSKINLNFAHCQEVSFNWKQRPIWNPFCCRQSWNLSFQLSLSKNNFQHSF